MRRSSSYASLASGLSAAPSRSDSLATTIGLGSISGRAILALGETVIKGARKLTRKHRSVISLASTATSHRSRGVLSITESDESKSSSGSSAVPGPGQLSGKAIKALGKLTLRGLDEIQLLYRLGRLRPFFPHGRRVFWEPDDGEEMYEELLDLTRPGLYSGRVRKTALSLLISQIGFREVDQLIKALFMWDAESILQLLYKLIEIILGADNPLKKLYLRFQDAPTLDPILPFTTFLLQLSFVNIPAHQAAQVAGSFVFDRLPTCDEPALAYHLLQVLAMRNPFNANKSDPRLPVISVPANVERWKFSWLLYCVAFGGEYWDVLINALAISKEHIREALILRLLSCVSSIRSSDSSDEPIDEHLLGSFLLACRQGAKSTAWLAEKDPVESILGFLLHALKKAPILCTVFGSADQFLVRVQPFLHSVLQPDTVPAQEVLQIVLDGVDNGVFEDGTPKPEAKKMRLCLTIYEFLREECKNWN